MINGRYGLLSTAGVCFALALGVLVGAGPLQGDSEQRHRADQERAEEERAQLEGRLEAAGQDQAHHDAFLDSVGTRLVDGTLSGAAVVVVALPGADSTDIEQLTDTIESAGAQVTGNVELTPRWTQAGQQQFLEDLTARLVTEDTELPDEGGAYDRAAAVLARAVVTDDAELAGTEDNTATGILSGLEAGELLNAPADVPRADVAVVLAGDDETADGSADGAVDQEAADAAWTAIGRGLSAGARGVVVAGDGAGGALAAVRTDGPASDEVSTVDNLGHASGPVVTVLALAEQRDGGVGAYGAAESADAPAPDPVTPDEADEPDDEETGDEETGDEETGDEETGG